MKNQKTILIFGISSFVGSNLAEILKSDYHIVGTYYSTPVDVPGATVVKCDVLDKDFVQHLVYSYKPDVTIYSVGLTNFMTCHEFPKLADAINTAGIFNVSQASERYRAKLIFLSSSYVFSGEDLEFRESDSPTPLTVYGKTKASAEFYIQKSCLNYIIFRCAPIFGHGINKDDPKFVEVLEREEFKKKRIVCDDKVKTGFVDVFSLAGLIHRSIEMELTNRLIQVSSDTIMTHFEFAKLYLKKKLGEVTLLSSGDWEFPASGTSDLVFKMDTSNLSHELNFPLLDVSEMIDQYLEKMGMDSKKKNSKLSS